MEVPSTQRAKEVIVWKTIGVMLVVGMVMVLAFSFGLSTNAKFFFFSASTGVLIGGAFFTAGGLAGFLFGIPKLIQSNSTPGANSNKTIILHNDNLVQISDWLTKIIVGVGLTQLYNIPHFVFHMGEKLNSSFGGDKSGTNAAIATVCYFVVIGFFSVYLWTRIYFVKILKVLDDELDPITILNKKITENAEEQDRKLNISIISAKIDQFEKLRNTIINAENNFEGLKDLFKIYTPGPIKIINDAQKGRWGGSTEVNGVKIQVDFQESSDISSDNKKIFSIILTVTGSLDNQLFGKVYFFLHESYIPNHIVVVEAYNNSATLTIESYEAFTIGVLCQAGAVALELDLNQQPKAPKEYKYSDQLLSIDDLYEQKAQLLE